MRVFVWLSIISGGKDDVLEPVLGQLLERTRRLPYQVGDCRLRNHSGGDPSMTWVTDNLSYEDVLAHVDEQIRLGDQSVKRAQAAMRLLRGSGERVTVLDWSLVRDGHVDYE